MEENQQTKKLPAQPPISSQSSQPAFGVSSAQSSPIMPQLDKYSSFSLYGSRIPLDQSHQQSMASLQSMESSEIFISQNLTNQTFQINYNNAIFMVNPVLLSSKSQKFKELIEPFNLQSENNIIHLKIVDNTFSIRNMENFLKLCQNIPTDVKNDEMKEICEISKMFQANQIYETGLKFIRDLIDPEFSVPDDKYEDREYLYIEKVALKESKDENLEEIESSIIYQLKIESRGLKCTIYRFYSNGNLLFSAKRKYYDIYFVSGDDVHIEKNKSAHIGHIHQYTANYNMIRARDYKYKLLYVNSGKPDELSIEVSFPTKFERINWSPKPPKYDPEKNKYYLNFGGNYHKSPMKSSKNIVLQNSNGHTAFITRKMDQKIFEVECHPEIDPLIAFEIALSDIVGPYIP